LFAAAIGAATESPCEALNEMVMYAAHALWRISEVYASAADWYMKKKAPATPVRFITN
jgi:hypothetical protein